MSDTKAIVWSMGNQPEKDMDQVRSQIAESGCFLNELSERHDLSDEAFEMELRLQIHWLTCAGNKWRDAVARRTQMLRMKDLMEKGIAQ